MKLDSKLLISAVSSALIVSFIGNMIAFEMGYENPTQDLAIVLIEFLVAILIFYIKAKFYSILDLSKKPD